MSESRSRQLAREFRNKIRTGQWVAGSRVPTTRELAASYGVSVNTVQNAFRELEASALVKRMPRLGGFVNHGVPVLSPKANTIAVFGAYMNVGYGNAADLSWETRIIRGCDSELADGGFHVSILPCDPTDPHAVKSVLSRIEQVGDSLGGVFCFLYPVLRQLPAELDRRSIAWVTVNRSREHAVHNFVSHDAISGSRLVGRCLARMGVDQVALLSDNFAPGRSSGDKYFGFMSGWMEMHKPSRGVDCLLCDGFEEHVGYDRMVHYIKQYGRPDAVYAAGDLLALGAMRALRDDGAEVGKDVYVIGSTNLTLAAHADPSLTVLDTPMEQMGRQAAQMLLEMAREGVRRMVGRYVPATTIVVRKSCPIPPDVLAEETQSVLAMVG